MKNVKSGDTIVFDEVSRMSRNAEDGFKAYQDLFERGIILIFLKEPMLNTNVFKEVQTIAKTGNDIAIYTLMQLIKYLCYWQKNRLNQRLNRHKGK